MKKQVKGFILLIDREKKYLVGELSKTKGLMPLLMKPRNKQSWSEEDRKELTMHMRRLRDVSPYIVVFAMPGGLAMLPVLAWWLDRRRGQRQRLTA